MAAHSSILAWRIPGIGEPGGLPPMGSHRVGHDWNDLAAAAAAAAAADCVINKSSIPSQKNNINYNKHQKVAVKYDDLIKTYYNVREYFQMLTKKLTIN